MIDVQNINLDDLPEDCRQIAEVIGLEALVRLVKAYGGETLYLPKADRLAIGARNREIRKNFNGRNYRELARRYNLTETWIREIVAERRIDKHRQLDLFQAS